MKGPRFGVRPLSLNAFILAAVSGVLGMFANALLQHSHLVQSIQLLVK